MAKRGSSASSIRRASRGGSGRQTSSKTAAPQAAEVEVVEESGGMGIDAGIAIFTFIILVVACLFVDAHLGRYPDSGLFF